MAHAEGVLPEAQSIDAPQRAGRHAAEAAFAGSVDFSAAGAGTRCDVRHEAPNTAVISAPGLSISIDLGRVDYRVSSDSVTLCCGHPRSERNDGASLIDAARDFFRGGGANAASLTGRFALIHIDLASLSVSLVTDRFAVHPICYERRGSTVAFSDRADSLPTQSTSQIDPQAIYNYVYFHMIPAPRTIFVGVVRVEPAQVVTVSRDGQTSTFWWRPKFATLTAASVESLKERFRELVAAAVRSEATTERVGCFLSGGTDSSTIAGFLGRVTNRPAATFSIGFEAEGYDEMSYARIAARHFGTTASEYYVTPADLVTSIADVATFYDQPFGNSSGLPGYYCAMLAKNSGIDKLLAGDGGDELFGGNSRYAKQKVFAAYELFPDAVRTRLLEPFFLKTNWPRRTPVLKKASSYVEQARVPMPQRMETYNLLLRFGADAVFTERFMHSVVADEPGRLQSRVYSQSTASSLVDRMLEYDWRFTLADNDLPKVTGTTRLAGEEVGFPFLRDEIVDFSLKLSAEQKVRGLTLRHFFKDALRGFLPDEIIRKRKHGFGLPFGPWLLRHPPLRTLARDSLGSLADREIVRKDRVDELFSARLGEHPGYFGEMIWVLMMLEQWLQARRPDYRP